MYALIGLMALAAPALCGMESAQVDVYLSEARTACPDFGARLARVAHDALETPYASGPLGEGPDGEYDQDPLIDLARVDCVTYVEQVVALAASSSYQEAFDLLQRIRYREGKIDFESRNHFMITDWIANNPWCEEVGEIASLALTRTISKRDYFKLVKAPTLGQNIPDLLRTVAVVPPAETAEALKRITRPALIIFVGKVDWLFALHCGFYLPDEAGGGKLYHASSKAGKVVAVDLVEYMERNASRYPGFTAYTIQEPAWDSSGSE